MALRAADSLHFCSLERQEASSRVPSAIARRLRSSSHLLKLDAELNLRPAVDQKLPRV